MKLTGKDIELFLLNGGIVKTVSNPELPFYFKYNHELNRLEGKLAQDKNFVRLNDDDIGFKRQCENLLKWRTTEFVDCTPVIKKELEDFINEI